MQQVAENENIAAFRNPDNTSSGSRGLGLLLNLRMFPRRPLETDSSDSDVEAPPSPNIVQ